MTPPARHDAHQAGKIVGKSASWMYKKGAAGEIPRSKLGHNVWWTDEQLMEIMRSAIQEPKTRKPRETQAAEQRRKPQPPKRQTQRKSPPVATTKNKKIPVADRSVSRLYRQEGAA